MRYIQRTKNYVLAYRRSDQLEIIGYSDSNFTECQDSRKSISGYIYLLAKGAISWKSAKQALIASSAMATEFIACYEVFNHRTWLRNFIIELCIIDGIERPLKLFCDNKFAVIYSNNSKNLTNQNIKISSP